MAKLTLPRSYDYEGWSAVLRDKDVRKIGNNTWVERVTELGTGKINGVAIKLHHTDIVIFCTDGRILLNSGGYQSKTTKDRMNAALPQHYRVFQKDYAWYVRCARTGAVVPFRDGMVLHGSSVVIS